MSTLPQHSQTVLRMLEFIRDNPIQFSFGRSEINPNASVDNYVRVELNFTDYRKRMFESSLDTFEVHEMPDVLAFFNDYIVSHRFDWYNVKLSADDDFIEDFRDMWLKFKKRWARLFHDYTVEIRMDEFECDDSLYAHIREIVGFHMQIQKFVPEGKKLAIEMKENLVSGDVRAELVIVDKDHPDSKESEMTDQMEKTAASMIQQLLIDETADDEAFDNATSCVNEE
jgi:hypothetical protein